MKTILVTGAASGIGLAVTKALSAKGARVISVIQPGQESRELRNLRHCEMVGADLSSDEDIDRLVATVRDHDQLDGVVSCAGIAVPGPLEVVPISQIRRQYQVNAFAPLQIVQGVLPQLRESRGRLVVIGAGQARLPLPGGGPYGSSKAALAALMDSLRAEVSPDGIPVSVIEPGAVKTGILKSSQDEWQTILSDTSPDIASEVVKRYRRSMEKSFASSAKAFETAIDPGTFAQFVLGVLDANNPKPRYLIGKEAKALGVLALLPSRLRAALVRKAM